VQHPPSVDAFRTSQRSGSDMSRIKTGSTQQHRAGSVFVIAPTRKARSQPVSLGGTFGVARHRFTCHD
jgi:hypothetical protein